MTSATVSSFSSTKKIDLGGGLTLREALAEFVGSDVLGVERSLAGEVVRLNGHPVDIPAGLDTPLCNGDFASVYSAEIAQGGIRGELGLAWFRGITIDMYYNDHSPPHFHVRHGDDQAQIRFDTLAVIGGDLPHKVLGIVRKWAARHRAELDINWQRARDGLPMERIAPLN